MSPPLPQKQHTIYASSAPCYFPLSTQTWKLFHIVPLRVTTFFLMAHADPLPTCVIIWQKKKKRTKDHVLVILPCLIPGTMQGLRKHAMLACSQINYILYNLLMFSLLSPFGGNNIFLEVTIFFNIPDIYIMYIFPHNQVCLVHCSTLLPDPMPILIQLLLYNIIPHYFQFSNALSTTVMCKCLSITYYVQKYFFLLSVIPTSMSLLIDFSIQIFLPDPAHYSTSGSFLSELFQLMWSVLPQSSRQFFFYNHFK